MVRPLHSKGSGYCPPPRPLATGIFIALPSGSPSPSPIPCPRMNKDQVAAILSEIGILLELKGENPFKTRAYHNGARTLEGLSEPLETLVAEKRLGELKRCV